MTIDMSRYLGLFVSEAGEHLEAMGRELLELEKGYQAETLDSLFRHAHSLKGMAASMGFQECAVLAHRMEDVLDAMRKDEGSLNADVVDVILMATDMLGRHVKSVSVGHPLEDTHEVLQRLQSALKEKPQQGAPEAPEIQVSSKDKAPQFRVTFKVAEKSAAPGVRAFLAHKKLSMLGEILDLNPSLEDLKAGKIANLQVSLALHTSSSEEEVRRVFSSLVDIEAFDVSAVKKLSVSVTAAETVRTVRVKTEFMDEFLETVGELLIGTSRIREMNKMLPPLERAAADEALENMFRLTRGLHDKVMSARMTPMSLVTDRLPRTARDVARQKGKSVEVVVTGADIEVDKTLLDALADPLLHVLRNAVDHGLELPAERVAQGKPETGGVRVSIRRQKDEVQVSVEDDGRGMDAHALRQAAIDKGALTREAASLLSDDEALLLCCLPGVSTSKKVTDVSGRGVGMDAVKSAIEKMGGRLALFSQLGRGTRIEMTLPLMVSVLPVLLVEVGQEWFGLPIQRVAAVTSADASRLQRISGQWHLSFGQELLPAYHLSECLKVPSTTFSGSRPWVIFEGETGRCALSVDKLRGQQEAVLKPLSKPLSLLQGLSGVTLLGTGRPVFILDVPRLLAA